VVVGGVGGVENVVCVSGVSDAGRVDPQTPQYH